MTYRDSSWRLRRDVTQRVRVRDIRMHVEKKTQLKTGADWRGALPPLPWSSLYVELRSRSRVPGLSPNTHGRDTRLEVCTSEDVPWKRNIIFTWDPEKGFLLSRYRLILWYYTKIGLFQRNVWNKWYNDSFFYPLYGIYRFISFIPFITKIHVSSLAKPSKDLGDYVNVVDEDRLRTINSRCKCQSVRSILRNDRLSKSTRTVEYFLVFGNTLKKKRRTVLEYYFLYTIRRLIFFFSGLVTFPDRQIRIPFLSSFRMPKRGKTFISGLRRRHTWTKCSRSSLNLRTSSSSNAQRIRNVGVWFWTKVFSR